MKKEYSTRKELKRLGSIRGSGTELVSVYIPPGTQISDVTNKLKDERGQAANIKSKTTRTNVQAAIDRIVQYLKLFKKPPDNGMAVFCGNISNEQSKTDIELFSIEPQSPIKTNMYRCDSTFILGPLEEMMEAKDKYAMVVMDGREATVALLRGSHVMVEKRLRSFAHAKIRKGGQSANRYDRLIEESIEDYYKRIGDAINELYAKNGFKINGLIVGGPGPAKENFVRAKTLNYQIKVLGTFDTGYTDESAGINELLEHAKEVIQEQDAIHERELMERFLREVARNGLATFGYDKVKAALERNNVATLLVSEGAEMLGVQYSCSLCGQKPIYLEQGNVRKEKHEGCGGKLTVEKVVDALEALLDEADKHGVEMAFISDESQYGKELLLGFGGIAAMLRYKQ